MQKTKYSMLDLRPLIKNRRDGCNIWTTVSEDNVGLKQKGKDHYIWVTMRVYKKLCDGTADFRVLGDYIKAGQFGAKAKDGMFAWDTINGYTFTGPDEAPVIIYIGDNYDYIKNWFKDNKIKGTPNPLPVENILKDEYKAAGRQASDGSSEEMFYVHPDEYLERLHREYTGKKALHIFKPRDRQFDCINMAVKCARSGKTKFLLGALPRFGKNLTVFWTAKELSPTGKVLVISGRPQAFGGMKSDLATHIDFADSSNSIELRDLKDRSKLVFTDDKLDVVYVSTQLLFNKKSGSAVRKLLKQHKWDVGFLDECHAAVGSDKFLKYENTLDINFTIRCSGTPYSDAGKYKHGIDAYFYDYVAQQQDKVAGICPDAVTIKAFYPQIDEQFKTNPAYNDDEGFNPSSFFKLPDEKEGEVEPPDFIHAGDVKKFVEIQLNMGGEAYNVKRQFVPASLVQADLDHIFILVPNEVRIVRALANLINSIQNDYVAISAAGNYVKRASDLKRIINSAKQRGKKTITISCGKFVEGITEKSWVGYFCWSNCESAEIYFQSMFRTCSPADGKQFAYVFDINHKRALTMIYAQAVLNAKNAEVEDVRECVKELLDTYSAFLHIPGAVQLKEIDVEDVLSVIRDSSFARETLISSSRDYVDLSNYDSSFDSELNEVCDSTIIKSIKKEFIINDNEMSKGKVYNREVDPKDKKELTEWEKRVAKITTIVSNLPTVADVLSLKTVDEILNSTDVDADDIFEDQTSVSRDFVRRCFICGMLNKRFINLML